MFENKKILALIPARGGSKGIKDKNIIDLCGKPLIGYSIDAAKQSKYIDDVVVSTDSEKIAEVARKCGAEVPFMRPAELAQDKSKSIDAVVHAINALKEQNRIYDCLVFLQPTQPLRAPDDIDGAIETFYKCGRQSLVSVCEVDNHPLLIRSIDDGRLKPLLNMGSSIRRQDMPKFYCVNGCIYINAIEEINSSTSQNDNTIPYIMESSHSVDIDELKDLELAKFYIENKKQALK